MNKFYNIAIYIRLSKEDEINKVSNSVLNQKEIILSYINKLNLEYNINKKLYIDDGYSGLNFNRPAFKNLINDIEKGKIDLVITKDLSRLGRNYVEVGRYLDDLFIYKNIRYIAILDNIDTINGEVSDYLPFKSIFNELYSKDISKKINSVFKTKMEKGEYLGSRPPYGYKKKKNKLVIDKNTYIYVKEIFTRYLNGDTLKTIATDFTNRGIKTPSKLLKLNYKNSSKTIDIWKSSVIRNILKNEVYIGTIVSHKTKKINFKSEKRVKVDKDDYIIVPNVHEPIIDKDTFSKVQDMLNLNSYIKTKTNESRYKPYVYCSNCNTRMQINYNNSKVKYFRCNNKARYKEFFNCDTRIYKRRGFK